MADNEEEEKEDGGNAVEFDSLSCSLILEKWQVLPRTWEEVSEENDGTQLQAPETPLTSLSAPERATVLSLLAKQEFSSVPSPSLATVVSGCRE